MGCLIPEVTYQYIGNAFLNFFQRLWPYARSESPPSRRGPIGSPSARRIRQCPFDSTVRTLLKVDNIRLFAWPSKGGVIVLEYVEALDLDFLGLDALCPPAKRLEDQNEEDQFCQRLLLLGARWWDSELRYFIIGREDQEVPWMYGQPEPTTRESHILRVGWPSSGGVVVAEFDSELPDDAAMLRMARTMDERSTLLRERFQAEWYADFESYCGVGFLNSWQSKQTGEVGPLLLPDESVQLWELLPDWLK